MKQTNTNKWALGLIMTVFMAGGGLVACGGSGGGGGGFQTAPVDPGAYPGCVAPCQQYPMPNGSKLGFYSQTQNFYLPGYANAGSVLRAGPGMQAVLKDAMGVCDRSYISGGLAGCSTWLSGAHDLVLLSEAGSTANTVKLIIRSVPASQMNGHGWYSYSVPNFKEFIFGMLGFNMSNPAGVFDPMVLNATIWPVNNSQGFEVRAQGPRQSYAWNKLFQLQVTTGKMEDSSWNYKLYFNGQVAMEGTSVRCQTQHCGLDSSYFNTSH